jgi:hypothetical protein
MTFVVILAIVAFGALVIRYSGGRTVKSTAENQTTTSRDGTTITFSKGIWAAVNHRGRCFLLWRKRTGYGVGLPVCATLHRVHL